MVKKESNPIWGLRKYKIMKEKALKSLLRMMKLFADKCLAEKLISMSTQEILLSGMPEMDWEEKYKRSQELISILETSKTEEEILDKFFSLSN